MNLSARLSIHRARNRYNFLLFFQTILKKSHLQTGLKALRIESVIVKNAITRPCFFIYGLLRVAGSCSN